MKGKEAAAHAPNTPDATKAAERGMARARGGNKAACVGLDTSLAAGRAKRVPGGDPLDNARLCEFIQKCESLF